MRMAAFDERTFEGSRGAVFYMRDKASKALRLVLASGIVVTDRGSRALVVSLSTDADYTSDSSLRESIQTAQEALDHWAVRGVMTRTLAAIEDEHILWWQEASGATRCRISTTNRFNFRFEARGEVRDRNGNLAPPTPEPIPEWHQSFRFFRMGQATTDLVDAFRNYYLAFESILSTIEPMRLRQSGRPAERERDWLDRALLKAASVIDFAEYLPRDVSDDPIRAIRDSIYASFRTGTFHAKTGAPVFLPHDDETRRLLGDSVERLRRLYVDLARVVLGLRFLGSGGLTPVGFQTVTSSWNVTQFYATSESVDIEAIESGRLPTTFASFDAAHASELDDEYLVAYVGILHADDFPPGGIRQVGALIDSRIGMYHDLEGLLDANDLNSIEFLAALSAQDPRALGTRYLS